MSKREDVMSNLQTMHTWATIGYEFGRGIGAKGCARIAEWTMDALDLISAKPRVMTLSEMNDKRGRGEAVYYENRDATCKSQDVFVVELDNGLDVVWLKAETYTLAAKMSARGKSWRCWTSRPTKEQRETTPWKE